MAVAYKKIKQKNKKATPVPNSPNGLCGRGATLNEKATAALFQIKTTDFGWVFYSESEKAAIVRWNYS